MSPSSQCKKEKEFNMGVTVKKFIRGGTGIHDIHNEIYQLKDGNEFFMNDPQKIIAENVYESMAGIPGVDETKESIHDFVYGNPSLLTYHPDTIESDNTYQPCEVQTITENGKEIKTYENTLSLKKSLDGEVSIDTNANFGEYKATEKYVPFSIKEDDVCYAVVGNVYRALVDGDTRTTVVCPPFDCKADALDYYEKTKECIGKYFSNYDVEVFSRKHLEQVSWYLASKITFAHYQNIARQAGVFDHKKEEDENPKEEDSSERDF